jgi:mRNA interferase MazF
VVIRQGDIYWVDFGVPLGSGPGYRHPSVVIQNNLFNYGRISSVVVCALTSNLRRASAPGNVLLEAGEGELPKSSVVLVSQVFTVDKAQLVAKIGTLSAARLREILEGIKLVLEPMEPPSTPDNPQADLS